jgi:hypothetical protein
MRSADDFFYSLAELVHSIRRQSMFAALAVILIVAWLLGFIVFHVTGGLIHLLLVVALVAFIWQLVAGRRSTSV